MNDIKQVKLSAAQQKQFTRLVNTLGRAQEAAKHAKEAEATAEATANDFLVYCAEELAVNLSEWVFVQAQMAFVPKPQEPKIDKKLPAPDKVAERNGA